MNADKMLSREELKQWIEQGVAERLKPLVQETVAKEEETRFRQLKWIMIFIGLVGLGTFGTLANYLIEKAVDTRIEKATGNISQTLEFLKFYVASVKLELVKSFSREDVDVIMNALRKARDVKDLRHSKEFLAALYQVTNSFTSAHQSAAIDEIFSMYEPEILSAPTLVEPLLHHYGQEIVASETVSDNHPAYLIFAKLERVASSSQVPELALAYRVLFASKKPNAKADGLVVRLIVQSTDLNEQDRARFFLNIIRRTKAENWMTRVTPEGRNIETAARNFMSVFSSDIAKIYKLNDEITLAVC